jgi:hypothetical protein
VAQRTVVQFVDDLTGEEMARGGGETVPFGLDGVTYEIDLSSENASQLRDVLSSYVAAARRTGGKGRPALRRTPTDVDNRAVRAWAASHGIQLSTRGRIPRSVIDQFRAAGN